MSELLARYAESSIQVARETFRVRREEKRGQGKAASNQQGILMKESNDITRLLNAVFDRLQEGDLSRSVDASKYEQWRYDFAFHMTDWMTDLEELRDLFTN